MPKRSAIPVIWLIQPDADLSDRLAGDLRRDGMTVAVFPSIPPALEALTGGERPAVLVVAPRLGPLTDLEFTEQAKALAPRATLVFTPWAQPSNSAPGVHMLAHPLDGAKLSRFIRLVAGRPAVRGALQALYRAANPPRPAASADTSRQARA
jgi:hypothetical protein